MKDFHFTLIPALTLLLVVPSFTAAQDMKSIQLPAPQTEIGKPLMQALKLRQTIREYSPKKLPPQELSNLLWAAWGINRPERGLRTAPSASNRQELDVYAVMEEGAYRYNAETNTLEPLLAGDIRAETGMQDFVGTAPLNLLFIADLSKMRGDSRESKIVTTSANTGFISQNVYLYCASQGLATVVRGIVPREELAKTLNLGPDQYITYAQTVGYPQ